MLVNMHVNTANSSHKKKLTFGDGATRLLQFKTSGVTPDLVRGVASDIFQVKLQREAEQARQTKELLEESFGSDTVRDTFGPLLPKTERKEELPAHFIGLAESILEWAKTVNKSNLTNAEKDKHLISLFSLCDEKTKPPSRKPGIVNSVLNALGFTN